MIKAIFADFFGTLVYEDGAVVRQVTETVAQTGTSRDLREIGSYWWEVFRASFQRAHGADYVPQRELEYRALCETVQLMIRDMTPEEIPECVQVIRAGFMTVAEEFRITAENAPRFTAFAISEERLAYQLWHEHRLLRN